MAKKAKRSKRSGGKKTAPEATSPVGFDPRVTRALLLVGCLAAIGILAAEILLTNQRGGLPLDAAFRNLRIADNFIHGDGFGINPGESLPATSAPLWVLILSVPGLFGANLMAAAKIVSALCLVWAGYSAARLAYRVSGRNDVALVAGLGTLFGGRLLWAAASGMETLLFIAVSLTAIERALAREEETTRGREIGLGVWLGASVLLRPIGWFLVALWLLSAMTAPAPKRFRAPPWRTLAAFLVLVGPWVAFCLITSGEPLPRTIGALRTAASASVVSVMGSHLWALLESNPLLAIAAPIGIVLCLKTGERAFRLVVGWAVLGPVAATIILPVAGEHNRYVMPFIPMAMIFGAAGFLWVVKKAPLSATGVDALRKASIVLVAGLGIYGGTRLARALADDVTNFNETRVRLAAWAKKRTGENDVIASRRVGALSLVGQRRVLDLSGVATREALPFAQGTLPSAARDRALLTLLGLRKPAYLTLSPLVYPHLTSLVHVLTPVGQVMGTDRSRGESILFAYRARWEHLIRGPLLAVANAERELDGAAAAMREGRADEAWAQTTQLEARGPLLRSWRQRLYAVRAAIATRRKDCGSARQTLIRLSWLTPSSRFRETHNIADLETEALRCGAKTAKP